MSTNDLHAAVQRGDASAAVAQLEADPTLATTPCAKGWNAMIVAAYHGQSDCLRAMLGTGVPVDAPNAKGTTPLMYAKGHYLRTGDDEPMRVLLAAGADPQARDAAGLTLLEYVPSNRRSDVAAILFRAGASADD